MQVTTHAGTPSATDSDDANVALNNAASSLHGAVDQVAWAADDVARTVAPAIDRAAALAHQTVDALAGAAAPTAAWLDEQGDRLRAGQRTISADTRAYVAAHPWRSVGFAIAAGFLIGRVLR